jgi:alpha-L-rhamnosidase
MLCPHPLSSHRIATLCAAALLLAVPATLPAATPKKVLRDDGVYQNGGYWATPLPWLMVTVMRDDPARAARWFCEAVEDFQARHDINEWVNDSAPRPRGVRDYCASAALPLAGVRHLRAYLAASGKQLPAELARRLDAHEAWLKTEARRVLRGSSRVGRGGVRIFTPDATGGYGAFWVRDWSYSVEGCPEAFSPAELRDGYLFLAAAQRADGCMPDRVAADGHGIFSPGGERNPLSAHGSVDQSPFMVILCHQYWKLRQDLQPFRTTAERLERAMRFTPRNPANGLVRITDAKLFRPYSFLDTVPLVGDQQFDSVLFWDACQKLAEMFDAAGQPDRAAPWRREAERVRGSLASLWDDKLGLFVAASEHWRQPSIWGSVFAVYAGLATPEQTQRIVSYCLAHEDLFVFRGQLRHLPKGTFWGQPEPQSIDARAASALRFFPTARPVWPRGRETEMNLSVGFRAVFHASAGQKAELRVAAATIYRAWINGEYLGCGPARAAHGYFRVDTWDLSHRLRLGANLVAIEVAGYNCNSYYLLDQPSFVQAEVTSGPHVLASTAGQGVLFEAGVLPDRVQKVQRYSFQRPFVEVYRLAPDFDRWRCDVSARLPATQLAEQSAVNLLPRGVPYPAFTVWKATQCGPRGTFQPHPPAGKLWKDRSLVNIGPKLKGFVEADLTVALSNEAQQHASQLQTHDFQPYDDTRPIVLGPQTFEIGDLGVDRAGFLRAQVTAEQPTRLWLVFGEMLDAQGDVRFNGLGCCNIVEYRLQPGTYALESIEPYTLRYVKAVCLEGACRINGLGLREYARPSTAASFRASDERLNRLFAAGVLSNRQNVIDLFMDCPSRERAGWQCDGFFTARATADLTGAVAVERNVFENYLLPEKFAHQPDGMLPMCYPADHNDGVFIPNWALWFVVQLGEYASRGGDPAIVRGLQPKVMGLFRYFTKYENTDGLLERLPGWIFVSYNANRFVQDVNYPTNMLYAGALSAAARLYGDAALAAKAERVRDTVRRQSFDGQFFVDNALRKDGKLQVTRNRTEACQYYAFFFNVATPSSHAPLWQTLREQFGPRRAKTKTFPEVVPAESFVGRVMRMDLLSRAGCARQIAEEAIAYWLPEAQRTGTLWEFTQPTASLCHGFPSQIVCNLHRDILGLRSIDPLQRRVTVRLSDLPLAFCEGSVPTPHGAVRLAWHVDGERIQYRLDLPAGYQATLDNRSGKRAEPLAKE